MCEALRREAPKRDGFTLVELLIAMTITLLLMAALGKSFGVIGTTMKEGRAQVAMSSKLRNVSFRLRSDLRSRTVNAQPPIASDAGGGYFMYVEGPLTEHTFGIFGGEPTRTMANGTVLQQSTALAANWNNQSNSPTFRLLSRLGDSDDYIAFTAEAPGDDWFTGKVPAYLVDDSVDANGSGDLDTAAELQAAMQPRVIRSKYAEIIMWASPQWDVSDNNDLITQRTNVSGTPNDAANMYPERGVPLYQDTDNDFAPDRMVLHQRTLLIRPDLNVRRTLYTGNLQAEAEVIRPLLNSANENAIPTPLQTIYPIGNGVHPNYAVGTSNVNNADMLNSNWLVGMAPLHQFFDLSLRRVIHPQTGEPTAYVACNSLADLTQPHNRFAHVRYPGRYMGQGTFTAPGASRLTSDLVTSMPLLATGWNDAVLNWQGVADPRAEPRSANAPGWFPAGRHASANTFNAANAADPRHGLFNGWLLPHFELGDPNPATPDQVRHWQRGYLAAADPRWNRIGEDVVSANVLAFDVRGFDRNAPLFLTPGPDGEPGVAGVDDDGSGATDELFCIANDASSLSSELGTIGSDDTTIGTSDLGLFNLIGRTIARPGVDDVDAAAGTDRARYSLGGRGDFVDLFYQFLAGTPLLNRMG
ncbi:MAG: prepilin-type N-terminal cleavage/methylation domain-containing protein, partial [Planctomycetota bacterium]